jgi:glutathione synthase/RimK-type ligase-like ATP-grasp enzyme
MIYIVSIQNDLATQEIKYWLDYFKMPYKIVDITFILEEFGHIDLLKQELLSSQKDEKSIFYFRKITNFLIPPKKNLKSNYTDFINQEINTCLIECLQTLKRKHVVINNPTFIQASKIEQLRLAQKIGLKTPKTFFVTQYIHLLDLLKKGEEYVVKSSSETILVKKNNKTSQISYTSDISMSKILNKVDKIYPSYIQQKVKVDYEIRVFVFEDYIKSCAIFNKKNNTDYRKSYSNGDLNYFPYQLPVDISSKMCLLLKELNIQTASIDLLKSNGEYYFLELNPSGQYNFIDSECNYGLSKLIAEKLCEYEKKIS